MINSPERCEQTIIHHDTVHAVREQMPQDEILYDLAECFKVFGDSTRIKILWALTAAELCVCDLAALLGMTTSAVSHQLRILKQARLVRFRREGKISYYSLDDEHVALIFDQAMVHIKERTGVSVD